MNVDVQVQTVVRAPLAKVAGHASDPSHWRLDGSLMSRAMRRATTRDLAVLKAITEAC